MKTNQFTIKESVEIPGTDITLEKGDKVYYKEATEIFKKSFLKHPGDMWYSKDKYWGVYWDSEDPSTIWIYHTDSYGEDYYETEALDYKVVESTSFKEASVSEIEKVLNLEEEDCSEEKIFCHGRISGDYYSSGAVLLLCQ